MEKVKCNQCGKDNIFNAKYCMYCGYELPEIEIITGDVEVQADNSKKSFPIKNIIGWSFVVLVVLIIIYVTQQLFFTSSINHDIVKVANEVNKMCPFMVDSETRLDNSIALPGDILQYFYTLVNMDKSNMDTLKFKKLLEPVVINFIKNNPQMNYIRINEWNLNYYYKDKHGNYLFMIEVTPKMYK